MIDLDHFLPAIAAGDADAFGRWLAAAERELRIGLRSFAADVDTEAILQEALLRTWQIAPKVQRDGRANSLLRVAIRIARNLAVSETRRSIPAPIDTEEIERRLIDRGPRASDPFLRDIIESCRELLPPQPAKALTARLELSGPDDELATTLGMKKNTFLQNFGRARKMLAECLEKNGVDLQRELT